MKHIPRILNCTAVKMFAVLGDVAQTQPSMILKNVAHRACNITQLAICKRNEAPEFALYYCDADWNTKRTRYFSSIDEAVRNVEIEYPSILVTWLTPKEAARYQRGFELDLRCVFCGKTFSGCENLIAGDGACICHECVGNYHEQYIQKTGPGRSNLGGVL